MRFLGYSLLLVALLRLLKPGVHHTWLLIIGLSITVTGLGQYFFYPDLRFLGQGWDPHYYRLTGTLLDPGFTGLLLVFTVIYISIHPPRSQVLSWMAWSIAFLALVLTYSRASYLALIAAQAYLSLRYRSVVAVLLILASLGLAYLALPRPAGEGGNLARTSTIQARLANWRTSLQLFAGHPVIGVGFNLFRYAQREAGFLPGDTWYLNHAGAGADMSLLFVAATTGVVGLISYGYFLYRLFLLPSLLLRTSLMALMTHSFFLNSLFFPPVLFWLGLLVALAISGTLPPAPYGSDFLTGRLPQVPVRFPPR